MDEDFLFWLHTAPAHEDWFWNCMEASGRPGRKREMRLCILYRDRSARQPDGNFRKVREYWPGKGNGWVTDPTKAVLMDQDASGFEATRKEFALMVADVSVSGIVLEKVWWVVRYQNDYLELDLTLDEDGDWWPTEHADPDFFESETEARAKVKELFDEDAVKRGLSDGTIRIERAPRED